MNSVSNIVTQAAANSTARRIGLVCAGVMVMAIAAQIAIPIPGTPIPVTLQVPAVLIIGGLLGPRLGAASLVAYLAVGAVGLPVYQPLGVPGFARLIGPTGGYLLSFPLAAALVGILSLRRSIPLLVLGLVGGLVVVHAGGVAQLMILGGDVSTAFRWGSMPFLIGDALKLLFAGLAVWRLSPSVRALL